MKRRSRGKPNRELQNKLGALVSGASLPLIHVTSAGLMREILLSGRLEPDLCTVFGRDLLYFSLLRPDYRLKQGGEKTDQIGRFPCAFVVDASNLPAPYHVYPFDTGAAAAGRFDAAVEPATRLEDYELSPSLDGAARHIGWAFSTVARYYFGDLRADLFGSIPAFELVSRSYVRIAQLTSSNYTKPDRRASAIEVAYSASVDLLGRAKLLVLPKQFLEDGHAQNIIVQRRIRELAIRVIEYDWQPNKAPDDFSDEIYDLLRQHFALEGIL
jgi:hypothetical protein